MKILRSILSIRSRAIFCFLVGVCVSPVLVNWIQASMLIAKANGYGVFVQEPGAGKAPIAKQTLPTQPAGGTIRADVDKGTDATIPNEPKEIVRLYLDSMRKNDQSKMRQLLSSQAIEELKRKQLEIAPPLGSEKSTFQVLNAVEESDRTLVESVWEEAQHSGETTTAVNKSSLEVIWELRKESKGWRICGMAVDPKDGTDVQIVDFENLEPSKLDKTPEPLSPVGSYANAESVTLAKQQFDPRQVTRIFLDALKRGDSPQLVGLLSQKARSEIHGFDIDHQLQKILGLGTIGFFDVSEDNPVLQDGCALVSSKWAESNVPSQTEMGQEFVWKLRWESNGWRIFGYVRDPLKSGYSKDFEQPVSTETHFQNGYSEKKNVVNGFILKESDFQIGSSENKNGVNGFNSVGQAELPYPNMPNQQAMIYPPSLPTIQNRPSASQDFELDAEIGAEIKAIANLSTDQKGGTIYQISTLREVRMQPIANRDSGFETYAHIQEVLNQTVTWYQVERDETSKTELHASAIKLANILFHLQQLKRKSEIGGIEKRLGKLKEIVATREKMSEQIVNSRVSQLLGISDGMGWDELEVREPLPNPITYRASGPRELGP